VVGGVVAALRPNGRNQPSPARPSDHGRRHNGGKGAKRNSHSDTGRARGLSGLQLLVGGDGKSVVEHERQLYQTRPKDCSGPGTPNTGSSCGEAHTPSCIVLQKVCCRVRPVSSCIKAGLAPLLLLVVSGRRLSHVWAR